MTPSPLSVPTTAFLFAGQGSQKPGMGKSLAEAFPEARARFDRANAVLGYDLAGLCFEGPEAELTKTEHAQPAIYLVSWVAFELFRQRVPELVPAAGAGFSLGEFTALAAAGAFSFEEGLEVVRQRGRFMQEACELTRGTMAAVLGLDESAAAAVCLETGVEIANLNCPGQIVLSGTVEGIEQACERAKARGAKRAVPLAVAGAYHSRLMQSAQPRLEAVLRSVGWRPPAWPVISNVTAREHEPRAETAPRLVEQVTAPVRWEASMRGLTSRGVTRFIEFGPGPVLSGFVKRIGAGAESFHVEDVESLEKTVSGL